MNLKEIFLKNSKQQPIIQSANSSDRNISVIQESNIISATYTENGKVLNVDRRYGYICGLASCTGVICLSRKNIDDINILHIGSMSILGYKFNRDDYQLIFFYEESLPMSHCIFEDSDITRSYKGDFSDPSVERRVLIDRKLGIISLFSNQVKEATDKIIEVCYKDGLGK